MRLEGIDPEHPSMYCVLSIAEVTLRDDVSDATLELKTPKSTAAVDSV